MIHPLSPEDRAILAARRRALAARLGEPVLLPGNGPRVRNTPNLLPFRQESNLLYLTACTVPRAALWLDGDEEVLFLPRPGPDDALWHGPTPPIEQVGAALGLATVRDRAELGAWLGRHRPAQVLTVPDEAVNREMAEALGAPPGDARLVDALVALRLRKDPLDLRGHRQAAAITRRAFRVAMASTHPGGHEASLAALFDGAIAAQGASRAYDTILTVRGEILHNPHHVHRLQEGDLLLVDGGAEVATGQAADVTRTWPVTGRFCPRARSAYEAVLATWEACVGLCRPGVRYRDIHLAAMHRIGRWMRDERLLTCSVEEGVASGAVALLFPHGVGHLLGLDVHDMEGFGDRAGYAPGRTRSNRFGVCNLRLDRDLEPGMLVTIEPGIYFARSILENPTLRGPVGDRIDGERLASWMGMGGIRIEDDVLVTEGAPEVLTEGIPRTVAEVEAVVGSGPEPAAWLGAPGGGPA